MTATVVREVDVLVVGAGPSGLMAANLLAGAGVRTLVVERQADLNALPRAVSIDDEARRTLQAAGLDEAVAGIAVEGTGTRYYGRRGQLLADARSPVERPLGYASKNPIDQPEFDRLLLDGLATREHADIRFGVALERLTQDAAGVHADLRLADGTPLRVAARFLLGCDGGRSTTRALLGVEMTGTSSPEAWLVVDTTGDPRDERFASHHGDPRRPYVIVPGRDGRCRYEYLLLDGEDAEEACSLPFVRRLLREHRPQLRPEDIVRSRVYRFNAVVADRWRAGRVFLLGDAAHMMPPFAGQGLNSGIRDARNLTWKLAEVLAGRAGDALLDTYEPERRPQAEATVRLSARLGRIVMTTDPRLAAARDAAFAVATRLPGRGIAARALRPGTTLTAGLMVGDPAARLSGTLLPQPVVLDARLRRVLLDTALGTGWALVCVDDAPLPPPAALWERLEPRRLRLLLGDRMPREGRGLPEVADADRHLEALLGPHCGCTLLVRPDRVIAGAFTPDEAPAFARALTLRLGLDPAPQRDGANAPRAEEQVTT